MHRSVFVVALVAVASLGATRDAAADDGDFDHELRWPRRSVGLYLAAVATYLGNESIGGPAVVGEYALGFGRWQAMADGTVSAYSDHDGHGFGARAGVAARWLARSFRADHSARIELFINGGPGVQHLSIGGEHVTRPDLWLGWGVQVRALEKKRMFRITFRVELAPALGAGDVARLACRGTCTSSPSSSPIDDGFTIMVGVAW